MSPRSGDDAQPPTALAKLYLEDGTVLTGRSFGCHKAVEGEVRATSGNNTKKESFSRGREKGSELTKFSLMTFSSTGRFHDGYGWIPREFDGSFLSRPNPYLDATHGW